MIGKKVQSFLLAVLLVFVATATASDQSAAQVPSYNTMQSLINAGTFIQSNSACNFTGFQATTVSVFTTCIENNGSCAGASNSLMPYSAMVACRVLGTLHSASVSFSGATAILHTDGVEHTCSISAAAVTTYTLPANTVAPTTAATELSWYPNGAQNQAYIVNFVTPSGTVAYSLTVSSTSTTAQVPYYSGGEPGGAWSIEVNDLSSEYCNTNNEPAGSTGSAPGTAEWYAP
jgi:hypothetical protein